MRTTRGAPEGSGLRSGEGSLSKKKFRFFFGLGLALVLIRSSIFLFHAAETFNADDAVYALMGKHLLEGRHLPVFMYGQRYLLGFSPWLAVPFFKIFGVTVTAFKASYLFLNLALVWLFFVCARESGFAPLEIFIGSSLLVMPGYVTCDTFMSTSDATLETFIFSFLLWRLRARPWWFGVVAGLGFVHRPFVFYAVAAIVIVEFLKGALFTKSTFFRALKAGVTLVVVYASIHWVAHHWSANYFGRVPEVPVKGLRSMLEDFRDCAFDRLPKIMGIKEDLNGRPIFWQLLCVFGSGGAILMGTVLGARVLRFLSGEGIKSLVRDKKFEFALFLVFEGVLAILVYAVFSPPIVGDIIIRYAVTSLMLPMGVVLVGISANSSIRKTAVYTGLSFITLNFVVLIFHVMSPWDQTRGADSVALIEHLESRGFKYGIADYPDAYRLTFLSNEKLIILPTHDDRVMEYRDQLATAPESQKFRLEAKPCPRGELFNQTWICP